MDTRADVTSLDDARPGNREKRRFPRTRVVWPGQFETGGRSIGCLVLNLSANGAKLQLSTPLGDKDWAGVLTVPRLGSFRASVAWCEPQERREVGLTFREPPEQVAGLLARVLPKSRAARFADGEDGQGGNRGEEDTGS